MGKIKFAIRDFWYTLTGRVTYKQALFCKRMYTHTLNYLTYGESGEDAIIKHIARIEEELDIPHYAFNKKEKLLLLNLSSWFIMAVEDDYFYAETTAPATTCLIGVKWRKQFDAKSVARDLINNHTYDID